MQKDLSEASQQIGLSNAQSEALLQTVQLLQKKRRKVYLLQALLYLGALIVLLPMSWFYTSLATSSLYTGLFLGVGAFFWHVKKLKHPGGILATLSVCMVPLIVYCLQSRRLLPELATMLAALALLSWIRYPLLLASFYAALWALIADATPSLSSYSMFAIPTGLLLNSLGFSLRKNSDSGFSFWSYLFGMLIASSGLFTWNMLSETHYLTSFAIHLSLLLLSGFFHKEIFLFFGAIGVVYYLSQLTYLYSSFALFPYALAAVGFFLILVASLFLKRAKI